jgi:hypothetical protein
MREGPVKYGESCDVAIIWDRRELKSICCEAGSINPLKPFKKDGIPNNDSPDCYLSLTRMS